MPFLVLIFCILWFFCYNNSGKLRPYIQPRFYIQNRISIIILFYLAFLVCVAPIAKAKHGFRKKNSQKIVDLKENLSVTSWAEKMTKTQGPAGEGMDQGVPLQ